MDGLKFYSMFILLNKSWVIWYFKGNSVINNNLNIIIMEYPEYTALALHLFIGYAEENTKYIAELENKIKELENKA